MNPKTEVNSLEYELSELGEIGRLGMVIAEYTGSLFPGGFSKKSAWIYSPNFVGFEISYKRKKTFRLLLRRIQRIDELQKILPLYDGPLSYYRAEISDIRHLYPALAYVHASWINWHKDVFRVQPDELVIYNDAHKS